MELRESCESYFNGIYDLSNYKNNDHQTNFFAVLKVLSYFTLVIPFCVVTLYGAVSLMGRVSKKPALSPLEHKVNKQAQQTLAQEEKAEVQSPRLAEQSATPAVLPKEVNGNDDRVDAVVSTDTTAAPTVITTAAPSVELSNVLRMYDPAFLPEINRTNLEAYSQSTDYQRHAATARIYYNAKQLSEEDALKVIYQREPTNIEMGSHQYNENLLMKSFGYKKSVYNDDQARKTDGSSFKDLPNSACVYSETCLWNPPGGNQKIEVACLSVPAPALDCKEQPHYAYYMEGGKLDDIKYLGEMIFLFQAIEHAVSDNKNSAFGNKGIKRIVFSRFGQSAFLKSLSQRDRRVAVGQFRGQLEAFLKWNRNLNIPVVLSEYTHPDKAWHKDMVIGDILQTAQEGDLIINAWDPHSAPGNGNDADASFDGAMGKGSGILLTQTSWLNAHLKDKKSLVPVK